MIDSYRTRGFCYLKVGVMTKFAWFGEIIHNTAHASTKVAGAAVNGGIFPSHIV